MDILIDLRLLSKGKTSGIEEYTRFLLENLIEIDKNNKYFVFYNGLKKAPLPISWQNDKRIEIVERKIPNKLIDFSFRFLKFPKIEKVAKKVDLILSPHFNILPPTKAKRIITFHDLSLVHFPEFYSHRKRFWHWLQNYKAQAKKADAIIAVSEFTKNDLVQTLGVEEGKIKVVYSGLNPKYKKLNNKDEELLNFCRDKDLTFPFLLFVGVIEPRKNISGIIKAFHVIKEKNEIDNLHLIIVGGKGWLCDEIMNEVKRSPFQKQIIFWGHASEKELLFLYNLANVFVYPSFFEGFGFPPLEAQICGTPVVSSNRSSLPEILGKSALLVNPCQLEELVLAIESLIFDGKLREKIVKEGLQNASRFNWSKTAKRVINIIKETS